MATTSAQSAAEAAVVPGAPRQIDSPAPLVGGSAADAGTRVRPSHGFWRASAGRLLRNKVAVAALLGLAVMVGTCFSAPLIERRLGVQRDKIDLLQNYAAPSAAHLFGTDEYGRDYFIRLLYGGQISILMGIAVTVIVLLIAIPLGLVSGYQGGLVDDAFLWVVQVMNTVPILFVLILVATWIPPTPVSLAIIIGLVSWTGEARQARGLTLQIKRTDYVLAARALGARNTRIMFRHVMPNIVSLMIVLAAFQVIGGVLAEVGLSFLGLGIRPPLPSWGNMLTNSLTYVNKAPYLVVFPGLAVGLLVLCVYMLADGLRDAFDPRLKE
ncbi:MAG TPA: ABC transporter permease [Chloroflexota bacterium]|nr:ABC transporter permease [Chloroflexota bacterium]